jgi:glycosyltransferase A (GT-A) superfamily protein (DUF2064 family)
MTVVAVLCDPPREGLVLPRLPDTSPLSPADAVDLYVAGLRDVARAVEESGGDLLVNYRPDDALPAEHRGETSAEADVRAAVRPALSDPDEARFEVQVGETFAGRAGNTVTHLLENEGATTAAVVEPTAPTLARQAIDSAAMKLRRHDAVLGPSTGGRVYYAGFAEPIDFGDAYAPPALGTLTDRALDVGQEVDYLPMTPVVATGSDLVDLLALVRARHAAGRIVPEHTTDWLDDAGLALVPGEDGPELTR